MLYERLVRPLLFAYSRGDPEDAHECALRALRLLGESPIARLISKLTHVAGNETEVLGIRFPNPIGFAAGFEKNAVALHGIASLNPGFIEVGTITPRPQPGNPRPRMFRLVEDEALINRMGFNSDGAVEVAKRLKQAGKLPIPVGISVGMNKDTPLEKAVDDYRASTRILYPFADYTACNISSPNTVGLRELQGRTYLETMLQGMKREVLECAELEKPKPFLVKLSPDLEPKEIDEILDVSTQYADGCILCNTTVARPVNLRSLYKAETGGLSGKPLRARAMTMLSYVHKQVPDFPIIYTGGVESAYDARMAFDYGASLVQLYTGMIFEGPMIFRNINQGLQR